MKKSILITAALVVALGFSACTKKEEAPTAPAGTEGGAAPTEAKPADTGASADSVGVPECDSYISKYQKCIMDKVPESARDMLKSSFEQSMKAWKDAAATPEGKASLATACQTAMDAAKTSMTAYGCEW